jgi:hypothetical protein
MSFHQLLENVLARRIDGEASGETLKQVASRELI